MDFINEWMEKIREFLIATSSIKNEEMVMFVVQLGSMLGAGISLAVSLNILSQQVSNVRFQRVILEVLHSVEGGSSFADALALHPNVFSPLFINMVKAGESSGEIESIMKRLAQFMQYEAEIRSKVSAALFYPMILIVVGSVVLTTVIVFVLPGFVKIFLDAKVPLPLPTYLMYKLNLFLRATWPLIILLVVGVFFAYRYYNRPERYKYQIDAVKLRTPIFGKLIREVNVSRFFRTFSMLFASGLPLMQVLDNSLRVVDNLVVVKAIEEVKAAVSRGRSMADPLRESGVFPPLAVQMVAVGEETGALDAMLTRVSDYYDFSIDDAIKKMTKLIEPIFLLVLGGGVGFIFASMMLPMFNMAKTLHH
ncbi:MAG: type II secretion system F family protein [Candidatus Saganbacteria bacterium]|nr:type II secretion system F family protein [Candidatus Saganbacteria bacterium]